jgi:hypothetical protein
MSRHVRLPDDSALDTEKHQRLFCRRCILAGSSRLQTSLPKTDQDLYDNMQVTSCTHVTCNNKSEHEVRCIFTS